MLPFFLSITKSGAQEIDNISSFRTVDADRYARLHYENDFFTATDYYYSQGIQGEFVHPWFQHFFLSKILISGQSEEQKGISFEHNGFTPTSTDFDVIQFGDRPYAATLSMKVFSISRHEGIGARLTSSFSFGVIGPAAGGKAMQSTIHQWINDSQPLGWDYQIQNDIVLNYKVGLEKNILRVPRAVLFNGFGAVNLGTLNAKASAGLVLMAGKLNRRTESVFSGTSRDGRDRAFAAYFYFQPLASLVGYDATLQGGLFNASSPYTIEARDMERLTFQYNAGLVMEAGPLYLEYFYTFITREFRTGLTHTWGGIRIGSKI